MPAEGNYIFIDDECNYILRLSQFVAICSPIFFSMLLQPVQGPGLLFSSVIILSQSVGLLGRVISPSQGRYLHTGKHKHRIIAYTHRISMPWVGFEPTIPASEWAKTVHALGCAATMTGLPNIVRVMKSSLISLIGHVSRILECAKPTYTCNCNQKI
jgi:hypothetical protein